MRILIAEDERTTARALMTILKKQKYLVDVASDGREAWEYICHTDYDVIVLDIMMPEIDGITLLKMIRADRITTPVMLLTARGEIDDRVKGLEAGADDYLPKPFAASEFVARVKALSRRSSSYTKEQLTNGNLVLDCNRYSLECSGNSCVLNNKEYQLMELFMRHPGFVFSSEHLMENIWGNDCESNMDVVWTHIGFLRKKLKQIGTNVEIKTVRGAGYLLKVKGE